MCTLVDSTEEIWRRGSSSTNSLPPMRDCARKSTWQGKQPGTSAPQCPGRGAWQRHGAPYAGADPVLPPGTLDAESEGWRVPRTILSSARSREHTWCSDTNSVPGSSSSSGPCRTAHGCSAKASSMPCRSDGLESVALRSLSSSEPSCPALANDAPWPWPACAPFPSRPCGASLASSPNDRRSPFRRELPAPSAARAPQSINRRRAGAPRSV